MPAENTTFDLSAAGLETGASAEFELELLLPPLQLAGREYRFVPDRVKARLSLVLLEAGYAVSLSFSFLLTGPGWRCLGPAEVALEVTAEEFIAGGAMGDAGDEEIPTPYLDGNLLDLSAWARDVAAENLPAKLLCRQDCRGLCSQCGADLNAGQCDCRPPADPRWEKLRQWRDEG